MGHTWSDLIKRAIANDQNAFYELYQRSYDAVYRTVKSMVRDDDDAMDIVQDAFVKGFDSLSTLENPDNFIPWMRRIATNKAKDWFKKKRDISFSQMADEEGNEPDFEDESLEQSPEAVIDRRETAHLIDQILRTLSDEQRIAIGMYYYQNMSVSEIAEELGISENTVKSRLNYGRQKIKAGVEELEKKGTKLYSLAPIPFLLWLFQSQMRQPAIGNAPSASFWSIMAKHSAQSGLAGTAGAVQSVGAGRPSTGAAPSAGAEKPSTDAAPSPGVGQPSAGATSAPGSASAGTAAVRGAAAAAGKTGGGVFAKVMMTVLIVALVGGGVGAGVYFVNRYRDGQNPSVSDTDYSSHVVFEDPDAASSNDLLTRFIEKDLIMEKGVYNIEQPSFSIVGDELERTDTVFDPATGEFDQDSDSSSPGENDYAELYAQYKAAKSSTDISGLYYVDEYDYDGDGSPELLAVYGERGEICLELFDTQGDKVLSVGKLSFGRLNLKYNWQWVGRCQAENGSSYIVICDDMVRSDGSVVSTYYRISKELKLISSLAVDSKTAKATESFYDGRAGRTFKVDVSSVEGISDLLKDYGGYDVEELCTFYNVGAELNDFLEQYYPITRGR